MPQVWVTTFLRLAMVLLAGVLIGALYAKPMLGLMLALMVALGWHLWWLLRLHQWLNGKKVALLPEGSGIWPQVFARIDFLRGRKKRRGKRIKGLMKQMRQATRSFPDGGLILKPNNEILTINAVAQEMLGLKGKRDRGLRIENLIRDPDFAAYLHAEQYQEAIEIPSPLTAGRWISCHLVPYGMDQKLLLIRDVSAQRQTDEMRRDFVANASHELRTPLTVITGYLDALAEDGAVEGLQMPIAEMQRQANRMRLLVDDLLKLSELELASEPLDAGQIDVVAIMAAATQEAQVMKGCPENVHFEILSEAALLGDVSDVQSVLSNLVSNAVRYTPAEGEIEIRWATDAKGGYLSVRDSGTGIAREHISRLTERFYRVEDGRERLGGEGGTGLGLAIVKHALARHEAVLEIESELGVGTTFTCHFPANRIVVAA